MANSLNRFAVSSWMKFKHDPDGSLDLYFQNASPGVDKEANWLPAPKGPFNLTMRLYAPKSDALIGKWNPPSVMKAAQPGAIGFAAQLSRKTALLISRIPLREDDASAREDHGRQHSLLRQVRLEL